MTGTRAPNDRCAAIDKDHRSKSAPIDLARRFARELQQGGGRRCGAASMKSPRRPSSRTTCIASFPSNASEWLDPVGRRGFLKLMSASMALAGVTACTVQPQELIVPYVRQPEEEIPGKPLFFATAMTLGGVASGLLVESHEGRPTKIEGNPDHPASQGATDLFAQGSILTLYDPDRSQTILQLGEIRPWSAVIAAVRGGLSAQAAIEGRRPPHPHRDGGVADAGGADPAGARAASRREVDPVGAGAIATTRAPARVRRSASTSSRSTT